MSCTTVYSHPLTENLANEVIDECYQNHLEVIKGDILWKRFQDEWPNLFITDVKNKCSRKHVVFIGSLHSPDIIFEQIAILYSLPRYLCQSFIFVLPYFPTATMERVDTEGRVATASTMARILSAIPLSSQGPCQIVIFDIHALQERFYFGDTVIPRLESAIPLLLKELDKASHHKKISITFPDDGAYKRFHTMFESRYSFVTCIKIRNEDERVIKIKEGTIENYHCVIVDDLVMTGETLIECAKVLKDSGALSVSAYVTHAVFPKDSWKRFTKTDLFETFYITDTIPHAREISKHRPFKLLSISKIISKILQS
ncbi:uncharacterized protein LOC136084663 isoform X2 [Hydra vulgaris]|uniref:Uncharacterized protein LOC136084663 isoform X2 n=1 Tax=Hydra vulgaris TaxID=6087 RepID=A0ABM4CHF4_HYDVU